MSKSMNNLPIEEVFLLAEVDENEAVRWAIKKGHFEIVKYLQEHSWT